MSTPARFCGNCGASLRPGSRFCVECGEAVMANPSPSADPEAVTERYDPALPASGGPGYGAATMAPAAAGWDPMAVPQPAVAPPRIAPIGQRFVALLVDGLALFGVLFLIGSLVANTTDDPTEYGFNLEGGPAGIAIGLGVGAHLLYFLLFEAVAGVTLGKLV